jgi:hypothetical protein
MAPEDAGAEETAEVEDDPPEEDEAQPPTLKINSAKTNVRPKNLNLVGIITTSYPRFNTGPKSPPAVFHKVGIPKTDSTIPRLFPGLRRSCH